MITGRMEIYSKKTEDDERQGIYRKKTEHDERQGIRTLATGNIAFNNIFFFLQTFLTVTAALLFLE